MKTISSEDLTGILRNIINSTESNQLLDELRKPLNAFGWEHLDLFMFSEDLDSFYFPRSSSEKTDTFYREIFNNISLGNTDPESLKEKRREFEEQLTQKTGKHILLYNLLSDTGYLGFLMIAVSPDKMESFGKSTADLYSSICESAVNLQSIRLKNEKLELEKKIYQKNLNQSENLKLLGEMIGGITHDLNNVFTGVVGFSQLMEMFVEDPEILDSVQEIVKVSEDGKKIINFISRTKKVSPDEMTGMSSCLEIIEKSADQLRPLILQLYPGSDPHSFFTITGNKTLTQEIPPALSEQLYMHIFTRLIKSGAGKIEIDLKTDGKGKRISIKHSPGKIADSFSKNQSAIEFPHSLLLYQLSDQLNFDFSITPGLIDITFPSERSKPAALGGAKILVFDPDEKILSMYEKIFKKMSIHGYYCKTMEEFNKNLDENADIIDRIIIDSDVVTKVQDTDMNKTTAPVVLTSAWWSYLDMEKFQNSFVDRVLLKPFHLDKLMKILK